MHARTVQQRTVGAVWKMLGWVNSTAVAPLGRVVWTRESTEFTASKHPNQGHGMLHKSRSLQTPRVARSLRGGLNQCLLGRETSVSQSQPRGGAKQRKWDVLTIEVVWSGAL